ncbi:hypothetical protein E4T48_00069 [Aureobasidium sp. EXF-10727]|nr:hypothetical protein E4T48_00069 [Aureobasidium sp. EXF-10727]KAI4728731.1 hypothetical protein E4T49_03486 [Aureobasidium sp. EXF-10728]
MAESDRVRLHITPFNATLYQNIIPASVQPNVTNISYHQVQTFPERGFGFVELPRQDADKLRKKLNGATLRGQKMAIQEAKPEKRRRRDKDDDVQEEAEKQPRKKAKKEKSSKKKDKEITGFELPDNRQVKRGWTEEPGKYNKDKKEKSHKASSEKTDKKDKTPKREKSKYSSKPELLFKQKLPEAVMMAQKAEGKDKKNKKSKQPKNITVIHEFEKNKPVPSFLKSDVSSKASSTADFVPGKGWVDAEGNVVEEVQVKPKREDRIAKMTDTPVEFRIKPAAPKEPAMHKDITAGAKALGYDSSSDESSDVSSESDEEMSDDNDDDEEEDEEAEEAKEAEQEEIAEEIKEGAEEIAAPAPTEQQDEPTPDSSASPSDDDTPAKKTPTPPPAQKSPSPETMDAKPTTPPREIHPLEALFKKKAPSDTTPRPAPINTSFSFGISEDIDEDMDDAPFDPTYPSTPYTRTRDIRSAAPTPDTAAIGRKFSFSFANQFADEGLEEEGYEDDEQAWQQNANMEPLGIKENGEAEAEEETEFSKWFWENRGDSNRAWKKRRRDVMKVKRQRENRRVSRRVV